MKIHTILSYIVVALLLLLAPLTSWAISITDNSIARMIHTADAFASVAEQTKPSVVHIFVKKSQKRSFGFQQQDDFFDDPLVKEFFDSQKKGLGNQHSPESTTSYASGSGFIINSDGYILTNNHVVENAVEVTVRLIDKRKFPARIIGRDPQTDIALLQIDGDELPVITLGNSAALRVGDWAIAIGSPFEHMQTVTAGIISAKGRSSVGISEYEDFIQTDAAINPGNSGGPLLNIHGQVIGMNTAFITQSGGYMGVGFAIPINMAKVIAEQLQKNGKMARGWLGVVIQDAESEHLRDLTLIGVNNAVLIDKVKAASPAAAGALQKGDLIVSLDDISVAGAADLRNRIALNAPGTRVTLHLIRNGEEKTATVILGELK